MRFFRLKRLVFIRVYGKIEVALDTVVTVWLFSRLKTMIYALKTAILGNLMTNNQGLAVARPQLNPSSQLNSSTAPNYGILGTKAVLRFRAFKNS